jgi:hypothetical protein
MFGRYRPGPTVTNLRPGDARHLLGMVVDGMAVQRGGSGSRTSRTAEAMRVTP